MWTSPVDTQKLMAGSRPVPQFCLSDTRAQRNIDGAALTIVSTPCIMQYCVGRTIRDLFRTSKLFHCAALWPGCGLPCVNVLRFLRVNVCQCFSCHFTLPSWGFPFVFNVLSYSRIDFFLRNK